MSLFIGVTITRPGVPILDHHLQDKIMTLLLSPKSSMHRAGI